MIIPSEALNKKEEEGTFYYNIPIFSNQKSPNFKICFWKRFLGHIWTQLSIWK
jgi:hypothetical protein